MVFRLMKKNIPSLLDNPKHIRFTINGSNKNNYAKDFHQTSEKDWDKLLKNLDMLANYKQRETQGEVYSLVFIQFYLKIIYLICLNGLNMLNH